VTNIGRTRSGRWRYLLSGGGINHTTCTAFGCAWRLIRLAAGGAVNPGSSGKQRVVALVSNGADACCDGTWAIETRRCGPGVRRGEIVRRRDQAAGAG